MVIVSAPFAEGVSVDGDGADDGFSSAGTDTDEKKAGVENETGSDSENNQDGGYNGAANGSDSGTANDGNNGEGESIDKDGFGAANGDKKGAAHGGDSGVGIDSGNKPQDGFTSEQEELYRCRYEEGYHLYDPVYVTWLEENHPETVPSDRYMLVTAPPGVPSTSSNHPPQVSSPSTEPSPKSTSTKSPSSSVAA